MSESIGNAALFCDMVGTLVEMDETRQLPLDPNGNLIIELLPGVAEKLRPMRDRLIFVVTNQAGVARGRFTLDKMEAALVELDKKLGGILTGWQICPHDEADRCACRKPRPGMITELARMYGVDLRVSTGIGDQEIDERACRAAGLGHFFYAKDFFGWA